MKRYTEAEIRDALDGTFTRVTYDGKIVTDIVGDDFRPSFKPPTAHAGAKRGNYAHWTENDDAVLLGMKQRCHSNAEIAAILDRTTDAIKSRLQYLLEKGRT